MCPLRPATDRSLGRPLPYQLANRARAPPRAPEGFHPEGSYAVLAPVSRGYSPLKGRLPTCYSPVRRFTHPRRDFLARLACVKRAASVDSEPGSNSRIIIVAPQPRRVGGRTFRVCLRSTTNSESTFRTANVQPDCQRSGPRRSSLLARTAGQKIPSTAGLKIDFGDKRPRATHAAGHNFPAKISKKKR